MTTATQPAMFNTVLVANRGEIACRVIRSLRAMGIRSVAVYSDADRDALHVLEADTAVHIGPAAASESYLVIDKIIAAAKATGAQAIHPGYGFLSENASFAKALADAGIEFIGPPASSIEEMGDKISAKAAVSRRNVPTVPGISRPGLTDEELIAGALEVGFPVLIKPSAGGGGKGMHLVHEGAKLAEALQTARREAAASFGDDTLFIERFVDTPRHIEVQVLADKHGNVIHLGERECSLQRRHQKVIEEAPSPLLDAETRAAIGQAACDAARSVGYVGAGTVEFIVSAKQPDEFFFMEMNTRLQVEHPVTEQVTGVDLVNWQVRIAAGEELTLRQDDIVLRGHSIEARVYAEDPARGFLPTGGTVIALSEPQGTGVRVDSGLRVGTVVGGNYDPMLSKVIATGANRAEAIEILDRALAETHIAGVGTNIDFNRFLLADERVRAGHLDTGLLDRIVAGEDGESGYANPVVPAAVFAAGLQALADAQTKPAASGHRPWDAGAGWRLGGPAPLVGRFDVGADLPVVARFTHADQTRGVCAHIGLRRDGDVDSAPDEVVEITFAADPRTSFGAGASAGAADVDHAVAVSAGVEARNTYRVTVDDVTDRYLVRAERSAGGAVVALWVASSAGTWRLGVLPTRIPREAEGASGEGTITSPMPGSVVAVHVSDGDTVEVDQPVLAVEAMKMEHTLRASVAGTVELKSTVGQQVDADAVLAIITPAESTEITDSPDSSAES